MKVLGLKLTYVNIVLLVLAALGVLYVLKMVGVKIPLLEHQTNHTTAAALSSAEQDPALAAMLGQT